MEKHKESIGENCQNGILNAKTSGTPRPNVPALRFPEFTGEWEMVSLQDIATINPKSGPLQNTFIYIDLEAVEKGELRKIQEIMREEAPIEHNVL